jgi:hypothetical protein
MVDGGLLEVVQIGGVVDMAERVDVVKTNAHMG